MRVSFEIEYGTRWGEAVCVRLATRDNWGGVHAMRPELTTSDGLTWRGETTLPSGTVGIRYEYCVVEGGEERRREWEHAGRSLRIGGEIKRLVLRDRWCDAPQEAVSLTSAFRDVFTPRAGGGGSTADSLAPTEGEPSDKKPGRGGGRLLWRIRHEGVPEGCLLAMSGSHEAMGGWRQGGELRMREVERDVWEAELGGKELAGTIEYKYLCLDATTGERRGWELRDNRRADIPSVGNGVLWAWEDDPAPLPFASWRGTGTVVPVFSLRSDGSFGIGDFGDLRRMVDWLAATGQRVLQLLPVNDTSQTGSWRDSYPYNPSSVLALHPIYTDLRQLPPLRDEAKAMKAERVRQKLNALPQVNYERVMRGKTAYLRLLFTQEGKATLATKAYKDFWQANRSWLLPYAVYRLMVDRTGTTDFTHWGEWSSYDQARAETLLALGRTPRGEGRGDDKAPKPWPDRKELLFHCYVQYTLHRQLLAASAYARSRGIVLKADIPIGVGRRSMEVWLSPHLFNTDSQAGAPPDYFSRTGQNWGFPTYNWDAMQREGLSWWRRRMEKMAEYFAAYRIDHVLGFLRIWDIPAHCSTALMGQFSPSLPMSVEEIEGFGLPWQEDLYTHPLINDSILLRLFGDRTAEARHLYLESEPMGRYRLAPGYTTECDIAKAFEGRERDEAAREMRDKLLRLSQNVLFLPDREGRPGFHPRISAPGDLAYEALSPRERDAFDHIYDHYFYHRHNDFWLEGALSKLGPVVRSTQMLPCAEDLGMLPATVGELLRRLGILSLEIQFMPKNPSYAFGNLLENPYMSVATPTTHDMPTLRGWWEEEREQSQRYYNDVLAHPGPAPKTLTGALAEEILTRHLACPSMLCLISLQDWMALDERLRYPNPHAERINIPAKADHYWRYRMHLTLERLLSESGLNARIQKMIREGGRQ